MFDQVCLGSLQALRTTRGIWPAAVFNDLFNICTGCGGPKPAPDPEQAAPSLTSSFEEMLDYFEPFRPCYLWEAGELILVHTVCQLMLKLKLPLPLSNN